MRALVHRVTDSLAQCELTFVGRTPIDLARARAQHDGYCRAFAACGFAVDGLDVSPGHADAVFVEDTAVVLDECAIVCALGAASRRAEAEAIAPVLARHRPLRRIPPTARIEGGDVLRIGRHLYVGQSSRTDAHGLAALRATAEPLGYRVTPVRVHGCLHLKTACTALADDLLLANPDWADLSAFAGMRIAAVDPAEPFAANVLRLPGALLASASHPRTAAALRAQGLPLRTCAIDELEKAEAGMTCLSLVFCDT